jgi:anti-sigma-K factor RskA
MPSPHGEYEEALSAYALGALDPSEKRAFEVHLSTCTICQAELREMRRVVAAIGVSAEPVAPPDELKARVLAHATAGPQTPRRSATGVVDLPKTKSATGGAPGWQRLALAASVLAAVGAGIYAWSQHTQVASLRQMVAEASSQNDALRRQVADARRDAATLTRSIRVLSAPDLIKVDLKGQAPAPNAVARAYWSQAQGLVVSAEGLPRIDVTKVYQLWVIDGTRTESAGLLAVDASGTASIVVPQSVVPSLPGAIAVSLEPAGGVPAPTGAIVLLGTSAR